MALSDSQLIALKAELDNDPEGLNYSGQGHPEVADLLNEIGLVTPDEMIDRKTIDGQELSAVAVISEYKALDASEQRAWTTILSAGSGQIDVSNTDIRKQIGDIWGAGTTTRDNLVALQSRVCSRAETLFGIGVKVSRQDVAEAVNS